MKKHLPILLLFVSIIVILVVVLFMTGSSYRFVRRTAVNNKNTHEVSVRLNELIANLHSCSGTTGIVGVTCRGKRLFSRATDTSITEDTRFHIASLSLQFTAYAVYRMQLQGVIEYEQPVKKYLPELSGTAAGEVTVQQLLNHTAGLPRHFSVLSGLRLLVHRYRTFDAAYIISQAKNMQTGSPGDTVYTYSEPGYALLAVICERVSGLSWPACMKQEVFDRVGMGNTLVAMPDEYLQNRAPGYLRLFRGMFRVPVPPWNHSMIVGSAGIYSTLADLLKWDEFLSQQESDYLSSTVFRCLRQLDLSSANGFTVSGAKDGRIIVRHEGFEPGYESGYAMILDPEISAIALFNTTSLLQSGNRYRPFDEMLRLLDGREYWILHRK